MAKKKGEGRKLVDDLLGLGSTAVKGADKAFKKKK